MTMGLFNIILAAGLVCSLVQGAVLMRKVRLLRSALVELGPLIEAFSRDVDRSETTVAEFRAAQKAPAPAPVSPHRNDQPVSLIDRFYQVTRQKGKA